MDNTKNYSPMIAAIVLVVLAVLAYAFLTMPDNRTGSEKLSDAIREFPNGPDKAARQLENRTPGERLGDAVKDTGDDIKRNTQQ